MSSVLVAKKKRAQSHWPAKASPLMGPEK